MTWNDKNKQVIRDLSEGKINRFSASGNLKMTIRSVHRKVQAFREKGEACFEHGNKNKIPKNKIDMSPIIDFITKHELEGCNFTELSRLLEEYADIHVSASCVRKQMYERGVLSVKCRKKTRKNMKKALKKLEKQKNALPQQQQQLLSALRQEEITGIWHHPTKPRSKYFGERLEMDASFYIWVKGLGQCTLHVCIDDATGFLVGLWLEKEETLHGYYKLMEQLLSSYGIPVSIRTDKRTVFTYNKIGQQKAESDTMTQFAYACHQLGVDLQCSSDPAFKPKVERVHQTLKGILPFRFALENIDNMKDANAYLQEKFIPLFNAEFGYNSDFINGKKREIDSAFIPCSDEEIRKSLAVLCERTVNKGHSIQLDNSYFALLNKEGKQVALPYHTKVTVARLLDGSMYATRDEKCYALLEIPKREVFSKLVDPEDMKPKENKPRPQIPDTHPWSYKRQMEFRKKDELMKRLEPYYKSPNESKYA